MDKPKPESASQELFIGELSPSVSAVVANFPSSKDVSAWEIIQFLARLHPEYGDSHAEKLAYETGPSGSRTMPVTRWLGLVRAAFDPSVHGTLHGRLIILGLSAMDRDSAGLLDKFGILRSLVSEVQEPLTFTQGFLSAVLQQLGNVDWMIEFGLLDQDTEIPERPLEGEAPSTAQSTPDSGDVGVGSFRATEIPKDSRATYQRHSTGSEVRWIQERLSALGYRPGSHNGVFGARTEKAVEKFQAEQGLPTDGVVDPQTWHELETAHPEPDIEEDKKPKHPRRKPAPKVVPPDKVELHADNPTEIDLLGRKAFAQALAHKLNRIAPKVSRDDAYMIHLQAPWGAGKTTFLNFLDDELTCRDGAESRDGDASFEPWLVVRYNAWQNQHVDPPWWSVIDAVYRAATKRLGWRAPWLICSENGWRFVAGGGFGFVLKIAAIWGFVVLAWYMVDYSATDNATVETAAKNSPVMEFIIRTITALAGLATTVWNFISAGKGRLMTGSANSALTFAQFAKDPMRRIREHFKGLVGRTGRRVAVFVDDLDRCQPRYVVELLEGIQTLFRSSQVVFVVAADRRWLNAAFEQYYKRFADTVREPGRGLGNLFLEKTFQLSTSFPGISEEHQKRFLAHLLGSKKSEQWDEEKLREAREKANAEIAATDPDGEHLNLLSQKPQDAIYEQILREQLVIRMAEKDVEERTEHFLSEFQHLMEPNPRAMKRLVNAFGIYRDIAVLIHLPVEKKVNMRQLALWTIIAMRWPILQDFLEEKPEVANAINSNRSRNLAPGEANIQELLADSHVQAVIKGKGIRAKLDSAAIRDFTQLRTTGANRP